MYHRGLAIGLIFTAVLGGQLITGQAPSAGRFSASRQNPNAGVPSGKPPGSISGKVVNSVTGQAIKRAVVNVFGGGGFSYEAVTDGSGAYRIDNVEPGDGYIPSASCQGFEPSAGARGVAKPVSVQPQQDVKDVVVQLSPHASISGKVMDRDGDPLENANVTAMGYSYNGGVKMLRVFQSASTDDRGQYRIADLQRGAYYISVTARPANNIVDSPQLHVHSQMPHETYPEIFYPSLTEPSQATPLNIKPGDDVTGIDFHLAKVPAFHIRGSLANQTGPGRGGIQVRREYGGTTLQQQGFQMARSQADGTFDVLDAVPGSYVISSGQAGNPNMPYGTVTVEVRDRDIDNVSIPVAPGFDLNGAVTIEGTPPANMPRMNISLRNPQNNANAQANVGADLTISMKNVFSVPYLINPPMLQGLYIKSMHLGSQDVSDGTVTPAPGVPLLITLGTDTGEIDVTVQTSNASTAGMWVAVYSVRYPARSDLTRYMVSQAAGTLSAAGLAPGEYKVLALETADGNDARNPDLRAALEKNAVSVTLAPGGRQTVQVTAVAADDVEAARAKIK